MFVIYLNPFTKNKLNALCLVVAMEFVLISRDSFCVFITVMETQTTIMDMDIFQTRLVVMLQWVTLKLSKFILI